jgi:hypothetical protein
MSIGNFEKKSNKLFFLEGNMGKTAMRLILKALLDTDITDLTDICTGILTQQAQVR